MLPAITLGRSSRLNSIALVTVRRQALDGSASSPRPDTRAAEEGLKRSSPVPTMLARATEVLMRMPTAESKAQRYLNSYS
jgi:hypothetical protein